MNGCTSSSTSPSTASGTLEFAFMSLLTVNESCNMNYAFSKKHSTQCTVICRLKAFGLYIFVRGFRRVYNRRGLYPRGFITDVEKALRNKPSAVLIKLSFAFTVLLKLQNFIINRIHFSTCGGSLYPGGVHDHNRMYFFNTGRWVHYWGRGGAYKWQFTVMKITE